MKKVLKIYSEKSTIHNLSKKALISTTIILLCITLFAQKSDILYLKSGNVIIGEIDNLHFGGLLFKTDDAGDLNVDWINVTKIKSKNTFDITLKNAKRFEGSIDTTTRQNEIVIVTDSARMVLNILELVAIEKLEKKFFSRIDGFIKAGFSYTKASKVAQLNASAEINYRTFSDKVTISGNTVNTWQNLVEDTTVIDKNQNLNLIYSRYFKKRWFVSVFTGIQQNTALGINYRFFAGGGIGKNFFESNIHSMNSNIGSIYTLEKSTENVVVNNAEGLARIEYKIYKKSMPKVSLTSSVTAFPSFTELGRVRMDANINLDMEIISDFTIGLSNYHNYDNKPISETASTYDWGIVFNLGYTF